MSCKIFLVSWVHFVVLFSVAEYAPGQVEKSQTATRPVSSDQENKRAEELKAALVSYGIEPSEKSIKSDKTEKKCLKIIDGFKDLGKNDFLT